MSRTWLVLDVSYLAYRSFFTTGALAYGGDPTGTIFGVLRDSQTFLDQFGTSYPIWCFDRPGSVREEIFPNYKSTRKKKRKEATEEEQKAIIGMKNQVSKMRQEYIYDLGYKNVFSQKGYEADDVIASVIQNTSVQDRIIIVSADKDLYQCLSSRVVMFNPQTQTVYTHQAFKENFYLKPTKWPKIKAIAGCSTDDIPGVRGVAEKTAAAYLRGDKIQDKKCAAINEFVGSKQYLLNLSLVTLPFVGCKDFTPVKDKLDQDGWNRVAVKLGMKSLIDRPRKKGLAVRRSFF